MAEKNGEGPKALGMIGLVLALITGIAAIVRPMQLQIDDIKLRVGQCESGIRSHESGGHPGAVYKSIKELEIRLNNSLEALGEKLEIEIDLNPDVAVLQEQVSVLRDKVARISGDGNSE